MTAAIFSCFGDAIDFTQRLLRNESNVIDTRRWQSTDLPDIPRMKMREFNSLYYEVTLDDRTDCDHWRKDIGPNLPWADVAFLERVHGMPWNPGRAWESWPWAKSAERFKTDRFSHTYAERYWPKFAGLGWPEEKKGKLARRGIRFEWGDFRDVVRHLYADPLTRQAYLPMWFPEDTGVVHGERVPCSLGYHFLWRNGLLNITYYIRSCDFVRHYRDDLYMTVRLLLWMLDRLQWMEAENYQNERLWFETRPGTFTFHCISMHCFEHDYIKLFGEEHAKETR
jgi:hypothetical protein